MPQGVLAGPDEGLFWSAVINGVVAVALMAIIILLVSRKSVMGATAVGMFIPS
jgi:Mn2+/Fe2+ NRAMP family transporter